MDSYFGRKIAIDASMAIYQFLIAVRQAGGEGQLTNDAGEVTSHLSGMLYRTIKFMEAGMKPVFVFDGKPPTLKGGQLAKRKERQQAATAELERLNKEGGTAEDIERQQKRTVRASREQSEEVKKLLTLMGVPVIDAPCEAEASCAALAKAGLVYGTGTEDMDALTFGTPVLVRHLNMPDSRKMPVVEMNYERALSGMDISHEQFVDLCILCGCDYADTIKGIGPKTAFTLIKEHKTLEAVLEARRKAGKGADIPEHFPYEEARKLFHQPEVVDTSAVTLKWGDFDEAGLRQYMIEEKQFAAERIEKAIERLRKCKGKNTQNRLESFFGPVTVVPSTKRKEIEKKKAGAKGRPAGKKVKK